MTSSSPSSPDLLDWLAANDEWCPACEYQLRGIRTSVCPECGSHLRLGVRATSLRLRWWLFAIVSFALGAGFDGVVAVVIVMMAVVRGLPPPATRPTVLGIFVAFVAGSLVCFAMLLWTATRRARWMKLPIEQQRADAFLIFGVVFLTHAAFGVWIL